MPGRGQECVPLRREGGRRRRYSSTLRTASARAADCGRPVRRCATHRRQAGCRRSGRTRQTGSLVGEGSCPDKEILKTTNRMIKQRLRHGQQIKGLFFGSHQNTTLPLRYCYENGTDGYGRHPRRSEGSLPPEPNPSLHQDDQRLPITVRRRRPSPQPSPRSTGKRHWSYSLSQHQPCRR